MVFAWYDHFLFALLGIVIPLMSFQSKMQQDDPEMPVHLPPKHHLYLNNLFLLFIGMLLCLTAWHANENNWQELGFSPIEFSAIGLWAAAILLLFYAGDGMYQFFKQRKNPQEYKSMEAIIPMTWQEYKSFVPLAIMAGVSEEVIYRGYLYHYLLSFFPESNWAPILAVLITSLGFSISHLYQGWLAVMKIFIIAMLFGVVYIFTKSLWAVIVIHASIDLISGMSGILLKQTNTNLSEEEE